MYLTFLPEQGKHRDLDNDQKKLNVAEDDKYAVIAASAVAVVLLGAGEAEERNLVSLLAPVVSRSQG
ncbi:hypothetical protein [Nitrospira sp. Nam74]